MSQYTPVSKSRFAEKSWLRLSNFRFAADATLVPALMAELPQLLPTCALAFAATSEGFGLMAVTGLVPGHNAFVAADGKWLGAYVPAVLRAYPFKLVRVPDSDQRQLWIDESSGLVADAGVGQAFFDAEGNASAELKQLMQFLESFDSQSSTTQRAVDALKTAGLLEAWSIKLKLPAAAAPGVAPGAVVERPLEGLWRVNETALNQLAAAELAALRDVGALALAYAHLYSMAQLERVVQVPQAPTPSVARPAVSAPQMKPFQLADDATLKFS